MSGEVSDKLSIWPLDAQPPAGPEQATPSATPMLALIGQAAEASQAPKPLGQAFDPRWVLAIRTAEQLQGSVLSPHRRDRLLRMGEAFGLSIFDSNLVIAIIQDQARRGHAPPDCPAAAESQLRWVSLPKRFSLWEVFRGYRGLMVGIFLAIFIVIELILLTWLI